MKLCTRSRAGTGDIARILWNFSRDGLVIKLRIGLANGVSIPLVVSALQKQIKQYITACTGVDVREVKVQVETASAKLKDSPFAVPEMLANPTAEKLASTTHEPVPVHEPVTVVPPEPEKSSKRPLHQRLFGREEQSMNVPEPPKEAEKSAAEAAESSATEEKSVEQPVEEAVNEEAAELEAAAVDDFEMPAEAEEPAEAQTEEENHEAAE